MMITYTANRTGSIKDLLGHKHLSSTQHYLKKNLHKALETAQQIELGKELESSPDIVTIKKALQTLSKACLGNEAFQQYVATGLSTSS